MFYPGWVRSVGADAYIGPGAFRDYPSGFAKGKTTSPDKGRHDGVECVRARLGA